jgi:chromosome segregation ATPase
MRRRGRLRGCAIPASFFLLCWLLVAVGGELDHDKDHAHHDLLTKLRSRPVPDENGFSQVHSQSKRIFSDQADSSEGVTVVDTKSKPGHDRPMEKDEDTRRAAQAMTPKIFHGDISTVAGTEKRRRATIERPEQNSNAETNTGAVAGMEITDAKAKQYSCLLSQLAHTLQLMVDEANKRRQSSDLESFKKLEKCRLEHNELSTSLQRIREDAESSNHERAEAMVRTTARSLTDKRVQEKVLERSIRASKARCGLITWKQRATNRWILKWNGVISRAIAQLQDMANAIRDNGVSADMKIALEDTPAGILSECQETAAALSGSFEMASFLSSGWLASVGGAMEEAPTEPYVRSYANHAMMSRLQVVRDSLHVRSKLLYEEIQEESALCSSLKSTADAAQARATLGETRTEADTRHIHAQERIVERLIAHKQSLESAVNHAEDAVQRMRDIALLGAQSRVHSYEQATQQLHQRVIDTRRERDEHERTLTEARESLHRTRAQIQEQREVDQHIRARADAAQTRAEACRQNVLALQQSVSGIARHIAGLNYVMSTADSLIQGMLAHDFDEMRTIRDVPDWDADLQRQWRTTGGAELRL